MKAKVWVFLILTQLLAIGSVFSSAPLTVGKSAYVYCNVFTSIACFGVRSRETLTMRIVTDYVLYAVDFDHGAMATIYLGYSARHREKEATTLFTKIEKNGDRATLYSNSQGSFYFQYWKESQQEYLEVSITNIAAENYSSVNDFIENIRSCDDGPINPICSEKRIFGDRGFELVE